MSPPARVPLYVVDAFGDRPFEGNPAAVCLLERWPPGDWLANVAAEMKHSETAYLVPAAEGFELRWFTPAVEVDLCGHATLASAHVLWRSGRVAAEQPIAFSTRSGTLVARQCDDQIELDFPLTRVSAAPPPAGLLESLGCAARYVGRSRFDYLVEAESESVVRELTPDFAALAAVDCRGVIVTARCETSEFDFVSRFFAPKSGVDEDPVTGSAHCALADYWAPRLGKQDFRAYQASRRGGRLGVSIRGDRVLLRGRAVVTVEGQLTCG
jgi:predicted PhzF superfamily epimerase YddE/YHI9